MNTRLSTSAKIGLGVICGLLVLFLVWQAAERVADSRADGKIKKAQAEADSHRAAAEQSRAAENQLQLQLAEQAQKLAAAEARADAAEQALAAVRQIRLKIEGDYQRVRDAKPDLSAPLNAAALCEQLKTLGKLPGDFQCK